MVVTTTWLGGTAGASLPGLKLPGLKRPGLKRPGRLAWQRRAPRVRALARTLPSTASTHAQCPLNDGSLGSVGNTF